jgi:predicted secreted hydrolase
MRSRWVAIVAVMVGVAAPHPSRLSDAPASPPPVAGRSPAPPPLTRGEGDAGVRPRSARGEGDAEEVTRTPEAAFVPAAPGYAWSFPRDHFAHPGYRTEWWYFTGIIEEEPAAAAAAGRGGAARRFGYQLTFFRVGLLPARPPFDSALATADAVMVHAAVTELDTGRHHFAEVLWRAAPPLGAFPAPPGPGAAPPAGPAPAPVAWALAPPGTDGRWSLSLAGEHAFASAARAAGFGFELSARATRPPLFQGPGGFSRKADAEGHASLYYSLTRMETAGTLDLGGERLRVRGTSWMDREFGSSQLAPAQVGWDWFALRLDDGRDLMLYTLRRADGARDFEKGTLRSADGRVTFLARGDFEVRATGAWTSPRTRATYPAGWEVHVPGHGIRVRVEPWVAAQENVARLPGLHYWEGAVQVLGADGARTGEGYVELTGYGDRARPPI